MLQSIRERVHGVISWILLSLISFAFILFGIEYYLQNRNGEQISAVVNGENITTESMDRHFQNMQRNLRAAMGPAAVTPEMNTKLKRQALDNLIRDTLIQQMAKKFGFTVSKLQAETVIAQIPAFQENGVFSQRLFNETLAHMNYTPAQFIEEIKRNMLLQQIEQGYTNTAFVTPKEKDMFLDTLLQARTFAYAVIPAQAQAILHPQSDKAIHAYYEKHKREFISPEKISISYITLSQSDLNKNIKVSDEDIAQYYEANKNSFKLPEKWRVAHIVLAVEPDADSDSIKKIEEKSNSIRTQLLKGESFEKLAKEYSTDSVSAQHGGIIGWITQGTLDPHFESTVQTLKEGEISQPIRTKYGYDIIKRIESEPIKSRSLADVRDSIIQTLQQTQTQKTFAQKSEQLGELTYSESDSLNSAAKTLNLNLQSTPLFTRTGNADDITRNKSVLEAAFSPDVLNQGYNSNVIQLDNDTLLVLRVKEHQPAKQLPLEEVKGTLINALNLEEQKHLADEAAKTLLSSIHDPAKLNTLTSTYHATWKTISDAQRNDKRTDPAITGAVFSLASPNLTERSPGKMLTLTNGDAVVVKLINVKNTSSQSLSDAEKDGYSAQLVKQYGQLEYDLWMKSVHEHAKTQLIGSK